MVVQGKNESLKKFVTMFNAKYVNNRIAHRVLLSQHLEWDYYRA